MILEPKENALRMKKKVERRLDRISDVRHPEKVAAERNSVCETPVWNGDAEGFRMGHPDGISADKDFRV